jgi:acetolactate synthase-1/2/3 large subunit
VRANDNMRTAAKVLVDQLRIHGVTHVFCVPGESYLAVLDAFHDCDLALTVCRQEGGAAMMAEAAGKATGRPGICFVTRGPGATNASPGLHIAHQDSTPMILFVGQVPRDVREREALQELDYRARPSSDRHGASRSMTVTHSGDGGALSTPRAAGGPGRW